MEKKEIASSMSTADPRTDDLDELLDSALDDFQTLNLSSSRSGDGGGESKSNSTSNDEVNALPSGVQGLGMGLPDLKSKKQKGKRKAQKDTTHVTEALDKLRQQTREAVKGLESVAGGDDLGGNAMMDDWVKQFEELAGSQDMESMVETMMQQLLSKEILYEPMKEIGEKYPTWLEDNKATLSKEEYSRFSHQYEFIKELNVVYENDPDNFNKIVELMQKMQECGQPPSDIVRELAPEFDMSNLGQLSPGMLESQPNCCIM